MSRQTQTDLGERVVQCCERIEDMESPFPDDPDSYYPTKLGATDIRAEITLDGRLGDITMVVQPSCPRLEFNVTSGTVTGYSDGDNHRAPLFGNGEDIAQTLDEHFRMLFDDVEVDT